MDNEQEQQEIQWGDALAQMRITIELFFTEKGVKIHLESGKDDILSDNKAAKFLRRMICDELNGKVDDIVKGACKSARIFARIASVSQKSKIAEAAADLGELLGLKDNETED